MEPEDTPPGLAMGLDLGTLRGLLEKQSGTLMASSKQMLDGLMREIEGKWMSQLVELHERITAQNEVVRELTQRCESLEEELRKVEDERGVALVQSQDCGLADLEPRGRKKVRIKRAKGATMCRENKHQDEESSVCDGMDVRDHSLLQRAHVAADTKVTDGPSEAEDSRLCASAWAEVQCDDGEVGSAATVEAKGSGWAPDLGQKQWCMESSWMESRMGAQMVWRPQ